MLIFDKEHTIFAFSDTHGLHDRLVIPREADILICAGDGVNGIEYQEFEKFINWYARQPAKLRIFIAGNHELGFDLYPKEALSMIPNEICFLENNGIKYDGIYFYSVAARPWLHQRIQLPEKIDFLLTHGPAAGFLDEDRGCRLLSEAIDKYNPRYHVFGHIHTMGKQILTGARTTFCNVSYFNELYGSG